MPTRHRKASVAGSAVQRRRGRVIASSTPRAEGESARSSWRGGGPPPGVASRQSADRPGMGTLGPTVRGKRPRSVPGDLREPSLQATDRLHARSSRTIQKPSAAGARRSRAADDGQPQTPPAAPHPRTVDPIRRFARRSADEDPTTCGHRPAWSGRARRARSGTKQENQVLVRDSTPFGCGRTEHGDDGIFAVALSAFTFAASATSPKRLRLSRRVAPPPARQVAHRLRRCRCGTEHWSPDPRRRQWRTPARLLFSASTLTG